MGFLSKILEGRKPKTEIEEIKATIDALRGSVISSPISNFYFDGDSGGYNGFDKLSFYKKYRKYREMMTVNTSCGTYSRHLLNLVGAVNWSLEPHPDDENEAVCEIVNSLLFDKLKTPLESIARRAATYHLYGFNVSEIIAEAGDDGMFYFKTIIPIDCFNVQAFLVDDDNEVDALRLVTNRGLSDIGLKENSERGNLPREKTIYVCDKALETDPYGYGVFRQVVEEYEAIQHYKFLERIGYGTSMGGYLIGKVPWTKIKEDIQSGKITRGQAQDFVESFKKFISEPVGVGKGMLIDSKHYPNLGNDNNPSPVPMWGLDVLKPEAGDHKSLTETIQRHKDNIIDILGIRFLVLGSAGSSGSYSASKTQSEQFMLQVQSIVRHIQDSFQNDIVKRFMMLNGLDLDLMPKLKNDGLEFRDPEKLSTTVKNLSDTGYPLSDSLDVLNNILTLAQLPNISEDDFEESKLKRDMMMDDIAGDNMGDDDMEDEDATD